MGDRWWTAPAFFIVGSMEALGFAYFVGFVPTFIGMAATGLVYMGLRYIGRQL